MIQLERIDDECLSWHTHVWFLDHPVSSPILHEADAAIASKAVFIY